MTPKKEAKKIKTGINEQSSSQNKKEKDKNKNECGCGCMDKQKK